MDRHPAGLIESQLNVKVRGRLDRLMKGRGSFLVPIRPLIHRKECFHLDFYPGFLLEFWSAFKSLFILFFVQNVDFLEDGCDTDSSKCDSLSAISSATWSTLASFVGQILNFSAFKPFSFLEISEWPYPAYPLNSALPSAMNWAFDPRVRKRSHISSFFRW